jgi:hypothetical protein
MATLQLRVTLEGRNVSEATLRELQQWLKDEGIRAQLEVEPPAEGELGGKITALLLTITLMAEGVHLPAILHSLGQWQQRSPETVEVVLHSKHHEDIQEVLEREGMPHIHVRELEQPVPRPTPVTESPPTGKK